MGHTDQTHSSTSNQHFHPPHKPSDLRTQCFQRRKITCISPATRFVRTPSAPPNKWERMKKNSGIASTKPQCRKKSLGRSGLVIPTEASHIGRCRGCNIRSYQTSRQTYLPSLLCRWRKILHPPALVPQNHAISCCTKMKIVTCFIYVVKSLMSK